MIRALRIGWALIGAGLVASPLAHAQQAPPASAATTTAVEVTLVAGQDVNPNSQGRPSPVVVRIFELGATPAFEAANYQTLFERADSLKRDLIAMEEIVLRPGNIQERNRDLKPEVRALGVAAAFRDMQGAVWHVAVPIRPGRRNFLLVHLDQNRIRLEATDGR
jgi:type VI secretion system protein VasD